MNDQQLVREIILKYHRGEPLTAVEQAILEAEKAKLRPERVWERVSAHIEARQRLTAVRPWYIRRPAVAIGVAAALIFAAVGLYHLSRPDRGAAGVLAVRPAWRAVGPGFFQQELSGPGSVEVADSAIGGQSNPFTETLPDGTQVILSYASSVRYKETARERKVSLYGHAYFSVAKGVRPFLIESGKTTVRVLGTIFDMMDYPGAPEEITLLEGKIQLSDGDFKRELRPAEKAVIEEGKPVRVKKMNLPEESVAWMGDRRAIIFEGEELYTVIQRLAQYYGVPFDVDPKLRQGVRINISLYLRRTMPENVLLIASALGNDAHIEIKNERIVVTK